MKAAKNTCTTRQTLLGESVENDSLLSHMCFCFMMLNCGIPSSLKKIQGRLCSWLMERLFPLSRGICSVLKSVNFKNIPYKKGRSADFLVSLCWDFCAIKRHEKSANKRVIY